MDLILSIKNHPKRVKYFLALFYAIGVIAIYIPFTASFFISLTPITLLMSLGFLALYTAENNTKTLLFFLFVFIAGYFIEVIGVNTGLIFGHYKYGETLGYKVFETPLMMGFNWVLMIYLTASLSENIKTPAAVKVLMASALMIVYDLVLEQFAPALDMWTWHKNNIPIQNYLAWFGVSLVFHSLLKAFRIKTINSLSVIVYLCQILFFLALTFKFKI